jgi:hypothetical protein
MSKAIRDKMNSRNAKLVMIHIATVVICCLPLLGYEA